MVKNPIGSATMDAMLVLYKCGKIEIRLPNRATGWLPLIIAQPKVERHIDGLYFVFESAESKKLDSDDGPLK